MRPLAPSRQAASGWTHAASERPSRTSSFELLGEAVVMDARAGKTVTTGPAPDCARNAGLRPKTRPPRKFNRRLYSAAARTFKRDFAGSANTFGLITPGLEVAVDVAASQSPIGVRAGGERFDGIDRRSNAACSANYSVDQRMRSRRSTRLATDDPTSAPTPTTPKPTVHTSL